MEPNRTESVLIHMDLDKDHVHRHWDNIHFVSPHIDKEWFSEGDVLKLDYRFSIQYFGDVAFRLDAVSNILDDPTVIKSVSIEELRYGRSIVVDVVQKLTRLIDKLSGDGANPSSLQDESDDPLRSSL